MLKKFLQMRFPSPNTMFTVFLVLILSKGIFLIHEAFLGGMTMEIAFREMLTMGTVICLAIFIFSKGEI